MMILSGLYMVLMSGLYIGGTPAVRIVIIVPRKGGSVTVELELHLSLTEAESQGQPPCQGYLYYFNSGL